MPLKEIATLGCAMTMSCPTILEVVAESCGVMSSCPAILQDETGALVVIGKGVTGDLLEQIKHRIGPDEGAVILPAELVERYRLTLLNGGEGEG